MSRTGLVVAAGLATLVALSGCARKPPVVVLYEPPVEMSDIETGLPTPDNSFALLAVEETVGRFACALAVAKVYPVEDGEDYELVLSVLRPEEQSYWCQQMRGLVEIREVIFPTPTATKLPGSGIDGIMQAAEDMGASLLLFYAPHGLGPNSARVIGALYELPSRRPLATFHSSALFLDEDGAETSPNPLEGDHRDVDARYQAQRDFESHVLTCIRALIERDTPPASTQPHNWDTPTLERWWVPQRKR